MIKWPAYCINLILCKKYSNISGAIIECGTWKGGMMGGIASILGNEREYYLYDSFQGLPPVKEIDGESALIWQTNVSSPLYYDNCTASIEFATEAMKISKAKNVKIIKGWFNETLPNSTFNEGIAILRMDADWYDSTFQILTNLFHQVNSGGLIIIDDYYTWDGCSKAIHDFLSLHKREERIFSYKNVCYIIKR